MVDKISNSSGICFPRAEWRINHFLCRYNYSVALLRRVWDVGYKEKLHQTLFSSLCVASGKQHMLRFSAFSHFWSVFLFRPTCCSLRFECRRHIGRRCMQKTQKNLTRKTDASKAKTRLRYGWRQFSQKTRDDKSPVHTREPQRSKV